MLKRFRHFVDTFSVYKLISFMSINMFSMTVSPPLSLQGQQLSTQNTSGFKMLISETYLQLFFL